MTKGIVLGQVGIRCIHCYQHNQTKSSDDRAAGSILYPRTLELVYQAAQNMTKQHLCCTNEGRTSSSSNYTCSSIPPQLRRQLLNLKAEKRRAPGGKAYWIETATQLGIVETKNHGLAFKSSSKSVSTSTSTPSST